MLTVAVVDNLAESRMKLASAINRTMAEPGPDVHLLPRITVMPLAIQELKFHTSPQVVIVGPGLIEQEITTVSAIRSQLPGVKILALVPSDRHRIASVEHLIRLGADDVVDAQATGKELLTRLVLLARRIERKKGGKLILVEGVKGGVGATSIVAACAEVLAKTQKKVVVVDGDLTNRGLSRFLRARPLINENLQLILDGLRSSNAEFVAQTKCVVEAGSTEIECVAPTGSEDKWYESEGTWVRNFMSTIEGLDENADVVLIDIGKFAGNVRDTLYRAADGVLFVASQDPACLPATVERVKACKAILAPEVPVVIVRNERDRDGVSQAVWLQELKRVSAIENVFALPESVPYVAAASRWPVSGHTMVSLGSAKMLRAIEGAVARVLGYANAQTDSVTAAPLIDLSWFKRRRGARAVDSAREISSPSAQRELKNDVSSSGLLLEQEPVEQLAHSEIVPKLDFFVSAPTFSSSSDPIEPEKSLNTDEELLVTPARISAA